MKNAQEAEEEAKRKVESVQSEIDDKLLEGKKKYLAAGRDEWDRRADQSGTEKIHVFL